LRHHIEISEETAKGGEVKITPKASPVRHWVGGVSMMMRGHGIMFFAG